MLRSFARADEAKTSHRLKKLSLGPIHELCGRGNDIETVATTVWHARLGDLLGCVEAFSFLCARGSGFSDLVGLS